ncbi:hypothetical protein D6D12_01670 [Aureobasidium pullulans]|uniref:NACHT domain-containing protein n=1 Tax=Aureobasidium pullulans TaxID=5580 RepID=A0AB74K321_AURPU|nr:hypothetical protein D6D12_01670 [Aureobasidium pullulans]
MLSLFRSRPTASPTSVATDSLNEALQSFQETLDPEQRAKLQAIKAVPDAHAVAELTHQLDQENARRKSRCVAARISPLLESLQQFSGIVETFVSSNPQIAASIWGSIKLVLQRLGESTDLEQIASNFTTYFDKLSSLLMTIGKRCPRLREYQSLYGGSIDLQKALSNFYSVVVRCCEQAVKVIRRSGYTQLLRAVTGSFTSDFEPLLLQINQTSEEVDEAIHLAEAKLNHNERQLQTLERQSNEKYRRITFANSRQREKSEAHMAAQMQLDRQRVRQAAVLDRLSSYDQRLAFCRARTQRHGSTGQWLVQTNQFMDWITGNDPCVFWCHGKLGSGKTVMTGYVVEYLAAKHVQVSEKIVYFFCQHDDETSLKAATILGCLARQCLDQDVNTFNTLESEAVALSEDPQDMRRLVDLLCAVVKRTGRIIIVFDGLDECPHKEMMLVLRVFHNIMHQNPAGLKLYIAGDSRIADLVGTLLNPRYIVSTHSPKGATDLQDIVQQLVATKRDDGDFVVSDNRLYQEVVDALSAGTQGMILWVKFQLEDICRQKTDESIRAALRHLPRDLFETYARLLSRIDHEGNTDICAKVFRWMSVVKRPLHLEELREAISVEPCQPCFKAERLINNIKGLLQWCHGLIMLDEQDDVLHFTHSSIKEFLCSDAAQEPMSSDFRVTLKEAELEVGAVCVTYLSFTDFKTQLIKRPAQSRQPKPMSPIIMVDQALTTNSFNKLLSTANVFMGSRVKPASVNASIFRPQASDSSTRPVVTFRLFSYAASSWLLHTADLSPEQTSLWCLWKALVAGSNDAIERPSLLSSIEHWYHVTSGAALRKFIFSVKHHALFYLCSTEYMNHDVVSPRFQALLLTDALKDDCASFIEPFLDTTGYVARAMWLKHALLISDDDAIVALVLSGNEWNEQLTIGERSGLLVKMTSSLRPSLYGSSQKLVQFELDAYHQNEPAGRGPTLIETVIRQGEPEILHDLCQKTADAGVSLDRAIAAECKTALHIAVFHGKTWAVRELLQAGADPDAMDNQGQTALHLVAQRRTSRGQPLVDHEWDSSLEMATLLLEAGADTDVRDQSGRVALECASTSLRPLLQVLYARLYGSS